jgi:hypothetical protein
MSEDVASGSFQECSGQVLLSGDSVFTVTLGVFPLIRGMSTTISCTHRSDPSMAGIEGKGSMFRCKEQSGPDVGPSFHPLL